MNRCLSGLLIKPRFGRAWLQKVLKSLCTCFSGLAWGFSPTKNPANTKGFSPRPPLQAITADFYAAYRAAEAPFPCCTADRIAVRNFFPENIRSTTMTKR